MAPHVDRHEIRWEHSSWTGTTACVSRDPSVDRAYGRGQSRLGYTRIQGALVNLNHDVSRGMIASILREHGLEPAPDRVKKTTWTEFLKTHWDVLAATDFFSVHVWTSRGLTRFAVLFVIDLSTRRVEIAGITSEPDSAWMTQVSRNVTDASDGFLTGKRFLIHDRDPLFTVAFRETLSAAGVQVVRLPPHSPNLNAYAERFVRTIKDPAWIA